MPEDKLSQREIRRYSRQIMIPEIGIRGQKLLKEAAVIVVGAGGLGCPVLQHLASGGVGRLTIMDYDFVDEQNLQRQFLYNSNDVGKLKTVTVSYTHLRAHETVLDLVCRLLLEQHNINKFTHYIPTVITPTLHNVISLIIP